MTRPADLVKTPAFPFYGKDAYDDEDFSALSFAAEGLWHWLAWWQWMEGSIPADIERILAKCPLHRAEQVRELWPTVKPFFSTKITTAKGVRLQDPNVETRRAKVAEGREGRRRGAEKTNAMRRARRASGADGDRSGNRGDNRDGNRDDNRIAQPTGEASRSALQVQVQSTQTDPVLEKRTEEPARATAPDFNEARRIIAKLDACALKVKPSDQIVVAWLSEFGAELIEETLVDAEPSYRGKHYRYLEEIMTTRRDDPSQRPHQRRTRGTDGKRTTGGNGRGSDRAESGTASSAAGRFGQADARAVVRGPGRKA